MKIGAVFIFAASLLSLACTTSESNNKPSTNLTPALGKVAKRWSPSPRADHTALWTEHGMLVYGGRLEERFGQKITGGGIYNPTSDSWRPISSAERNPENIVHHSAVWTGESLIVWGGQDLNQGQVTDLGLSYDPKLDEWKAINREGAPSPRAGQSTVWTGKVMMVWGGEDSHEEFRNGGIYAPKRDRWWSIDLANAPKSRSFHSAVWTGQEMIIFGGYHQGVAAQGGAKYNPKTKEWASLSGEGAPSPRIGHTAVWTGEHMIVWGGEDGAGRFHNDGYRYDPKKDLWTPLSSSKRPSPRALHTALWTGNAMVILGGTSHFKSSKNSGAIYDPEKDQWTRFTLKGTARSLHSAVWTGEKIVVYGGRRNNEIFVRGRMLGFSLAHDRFLKLPIEMKGH